MRARIFVAGAALLALANVAPASTADNAGSQVVVPFVAYDKTTTTGVFVQNYAVNPVTLQVRYVGERSSAAPGMRMCGNIVVGSVSVVELDLRTTCSLGGTDDLGMVVFVSLIKNGTAALSASARVEVDGISLGRETFLVDGLPLGALDSTDSVHQVMGLRSEPANGVGFPVTTDCFVGSLFDGSQTGGMIGRLGLKDELGNPIGSDQYFALRPFELVRLRDVFTKAGLSGSFTGARAEITLTGQGDAFLGYCRTEAASAVGNSYAIALAQVVESRDEMRKRRAFAQVTPGVQLAGRRFTIPTTATRMLHGVYIRRPDMVRCGVSSADALTITAVAPDGTRIGGTTFSTGDIATPLSGYQGINDLWGLEVSWDPNAKKTQDATYSLSCRSGNGTSLLDQLDR